jgi:integrase
MPDMGFRPEEIYRLEWPQIHGDSITIYKGKTDPSRRTVEITQRVVDVLTERGLDDESLRESHQYVFSAPTTSGHISADSLKRQHAKAVDAMRKSRAARAGVDVEEINFDFVPYSFRHTFCTKLAATGMDGAALIYVCGHRDYATTLKYIHLAAPAVNARLKEARVKMGAEASKARVGTAEPELVVGCERWGQASWPKEKALRWLQLAASF